MTTYAEAQKSITHTPCKLVIITADYCAEAFGVAPCTATGTECHNTWPTCRDRANYNRTTKDYRYTSADAPLPFTGPRRYIKKIKYLATEIKGSKFVHQRAKVSMLDEPELTDIGLDPYFASRSSIQGDYWPKWYARNKNYKNRYIEIKDGYVGIAEAEFTTEFIGQLSNARLKNGIEFEAVDLLKSLSDIKIPQEIDCKLPADVDISQTTITVSDASLLDDPAGGTKYYKINNKEIISYTVRNTSLNQLSGGARAQFGTTAQTHKENDKVGKVRVYDAANPFDILNTEMLQTDGGISTAYIDSSAFTALKTAPIVDINHKGIIDKTISLDKLFFDLVEHLGCKSWVNESGKITITRPVQNTGGRTYKTITDRGNIVLDSDSADLDDENRITRVVVHWNKTALEDQNDEDNYNRHSIPIDIDAESVNDLGKEVPDTVYSRWMYEGLDTEENLDLYIKDNFTRRLFRLGDPQSHLKIRTEIKDADIAVGEIVKIKTNAVQDEHGNPVSDRKSLIIKKTLRPDDIQFTAQLLPEKRYLQFAPDSYSSKDWDTATDAEREYGAICDEDEEMANGDYGPRIY